MSLIAVSEPEFSSTASEQLVHLEECVNENAAQEPELG